MKRQMVDMLADLIKIPSDPFSDKQEVLDYVQSFTDQIHMRNTLFGDSPTPALLAEFGQGGLVLSGHLDTPPIGDYWSFSQSQLASGRMYGRGAADMKGTVIAMLQAAQDLVSRKVPVVLALTTDEETTMQGAMALAKTLPMRRAKAIVVGEPTGLRVAYAEKGVLDLAIETRGKAAHGAMPHLGENAISKMMRILRGLESFKGRIAHPELGSVTMNIGTFNGGISAERRAEQGDRRGRHPIPPAVLSGPALPGDRGPPSADQDPVHAPTDPHRCPRSRSTPTREHLKILKEVSSARSRRSWSTPPRRSTIPR